MSLRRFLTMLYCAGALLLLMTGTALAGDDPDIDLELTELRVYTAKDGDAMLDYTIARKSWRALRDAGIEPRLNIFSPNRRGRYVYRYSVPLKAKHGSVLYNRKDVDLEGVSSVKVEIVGYNGANRVGRLTLGATCEQSLSVDVEHARRKGGGGRGRDESGHDGGHHDHHDDHHGHGDRDRDDRPRKASRAEIISACDRQTSYSSELDDCVEEALKLPFGAVADKVVDACGDATSYGSGLEDCLQEVAKVKGRPVEVVKACDAATSYDSEVKSCIKEAADFGHRSAGAVIAACDAHTSYSSELRSCVRAAKKLDREHAAIVNACGEATSYSSELDRCIERSAN